MATFLHSDIMADATKWSSFDPDYVNTILPLAGHVDGLNRVNVARTLVHLAVRTPTVLAIVDSRDADNITICHSPVYYPNDPTAVTTFDNCVIAVIGNDNATSLPLALADSAFNRSGNYRCLRTPEAAASLVAAPPVPRQGPHANGTANTDLIQSRKTFVLPPSAASDILLAAPRGTITKAAFHQQFVAPGLADADADVQAIWEPVAQWFRTACTMTSIAGADVIGINVTPRVPATPAEMFATGAWYTSYRNSLNQRAGVGGPQLTTHAFNAGITNLETTMKDVATRRLAFERARNERSFTEQHGDALAQRMYRLCAVVDDDHLPEVHKILAKSTSKSRDYAVVGNLF